MNFPIGLYAIAIILECCWYCAFASNLTCPKQFIEWWRYMDRKRYCPESIARKRNAIYLLYDINPPEGFNLRRDVYIRLANFVKHLQGQNLASLQNVQLVLPPWRRLYHWRSQHLQQDHLPWHWFFDIESMRRFVPVLDFPEFVDEISDFAMDSNLISGRIDVRKIVRLQHFDDMFENGVFRDKWQFAEDCPENIHLLQGSFLTQKPLKLLDTHIQCIRFQGGASLLAQVLQRLLTDFGTTTTPNIFAIFNAEIVLHDYWADQNFWRARRSMRFAKHLQQLAAEFRAQHLNSNESNELIQRPPMWEYEQPVILRSQQAVGGPYLAVHLRRGDFISGRENTTPTLKSAALQIRYHSQQMNLSTVFLATDASVYEIKNLKSHLPYTRVHRFTAANLEQKAAIKDGGIAIIDQLICAHASYFIGTYESTFTYRIYEEREILGLPHSSTFNTLCKKSTMEDCLKNSKWPIVF